jgi:PAS domain S-box-containing protein
MVAAKQEASWMRFGVPFAGTDEQELLRAIVMASPTAITVVDLGGVTLLWNRAAERLFGWSADEVLGRPLQDIEFSSPAESRRLRTGSAAGQDVLEVQARRRHRGGHLVHVAVSTVGLHDPSGRVIAILGIYRDVPERKAAEEERVS